MGATDYLKAFNLAYEMFANTQEDEYGSPCQDIILFLSDGDPNPEQSKFI